MRSTRAALGIIGIVGMTHGCLNGPSFLGEKGSATLSATTSEVAATVTSDSNGVLTAAIDPSSGSTQVVQASASSGISGSSISFPPGALGISTSITVEEGATLAASGLGTELGISADQQLTAASSTLVISNDSGIDAQQPFTVAIALGGASLAEGSFNYIILYKVKKAETGELVAGIIPASNLTVFGGKVSFSTVYFGAFQVATVARPIEAPLEVASTTPIVTKIAETAQNAQNAPLQIDGVRPVVAKPGSTITLKGKNFRPSIRLALANVAVDKIDVKSDSVATFIVPSTVKSGFGDLVADQDGSQQKLKMFALADNSGLPLITLDAAGVCAGVNYIDANGDKQVGTKSCEGSTAAVDRNGNGRPDAADFATGAEYSQGREGSQVTAAATLAVPGDGSFFTVTGSAAITRFATAPVGTRMSLYFTGSPLLKHTTASPKLLMLRNADFKVEAGDVLEFVAIPDGWKELVRASQSHTKFFAEMNNTGVNVAGETYVDVPWSNVTADSQAEYNPSTKRLTVREGGNFVVHYKSFFAIPGNTEYKPYAQLTIKRNGIALDTITCGPGSDTDSDYGTINCAEKITNISAGPGDYFQFVFYYYHFGKKGMNGPASGTLKTSGTYVQFERL